MMGRHRNQYDYQNLLHPTTAAAADREVEPDGYMVPMTPPPASVRSESTTTRSAASTGGQQQQQQHQQQQRKEVPGTPPISASSRHIWQRGLLHYSPPDSSRLLLNNSNSSSSARHQATPPRMPSMVEEGTNNNMSNTSGYVRTISNNTQEEEQEQEQGDDNDDLVSALTEDMHSWQPVPTIMGRVVSNSSDDAPQNNNQHQHQNELPHSDTDRDFTMGSFRVPSELNLNEPDSLSVGVSVSMGGNIYDEYGHPLAAQQNYQQQQQRQCQRQQKQNQTAYATTRTGTRSGNSYGSPDVPSFYSPSPPPPASSQYYSTYDNQYNHHPTNNNSHKNNNISFDPEVVPDTDAEPLEPSIYQECDMDQVNHLIAAHHNFFHGDLDHQLARMVAEGYPSGLARAMVNLKSEIAQQMWIVDNSGSMTTYDGSKLISAGNALKFVKCTRWEEIQDCVNVHLKLSAAIEFPMVIRFLNDPGPLQGPPRFGLGESRDFQADMHRSLGIMNMARPFGASPLTRQIEAICNEIASMESALRAVGQKVAVTICTDGIPSDSGNRTDFIHQLRRLDRLPAVLVIRMCTDEKEVVEFYNSLDYELETSMDVIDDYQAEANEIAHHNPWLNYGRPLHRLREKGCRLKVLDLIDERPLSKQEQVDICCLIFGRDKIATGPNPVTDWRGFQEHLTLLQKHEELQWDPIHRKMRPWIDFKNTKEKQKLAKRNAKHKRGLMGYFLSSSSSS